MNNSEHAEGRDDELRTSAEELPKADGHRIVTSQELLQGQKELWIMHGDEMYRLRVTSSGKLYLTK